MLSATASPSTHTLLKHEHLDEAYLSDNDVPPLKRQRGLDGPEGIPVSYNAAQQAPAAPQVPVGPSLGDDDDADDDHETFLSAQEEQEVDELADDDEDDDEDGNSENRQALKVLRGSVPKPSPPSLDYATTPLSAIMPPLPPPTKGGFSNPSTYTNNCPVTIIKRRSQFEDWLLEHKQHGGCRFYRRTAGLSSARNVIFLEKFGSHQVADAYVPPPEPKRTTGAKRGRPTTISFIETYLCHHHGKPQPSDEEEMNLPRRLFKNMYPCKCPAKIVVKSSEKDPTMVSIWYYWKHDGHPVCQ